MISFRTSGRHWLFSSHKAFEHAAQSTALLATTEHAHYILHVHIAIAILVQAAAKRR